MVRATIILLVLLYAGMEPAYSQIFNRGEPKDRGEPLFTPLKSFRERAATGVPAVVAEKAKEACASCKLKGKLFPEAACKRCQAKKEKEAEEEKSEKAKEAELKKLEAEAKKAELEAKKLEEDDKERNKPWDIADKENAELGDLLAAAASAKKEQDLAPKKQQALDYLASLGCSKDPNVTKAILAGLQDYNIEVRKTAVQAVIYAVQGPAGLEYQSDPFYAEPFVGDMSYGQAGCTSCAAGCNETQNSGPPVPEDKDCPVCDIAKKKQLAKENRKKQREMQRQMRRSGGQCNCPGNACGCGNVVYGMPAGDCAACEECAPGSDGCMSCCDPEIRKELRKMAFDPDPTRANCYYEPSIEVRNLALQAYNLCPELKEPKEDPDVEPDDGGSSESKAGDDDAGGVSEGSKDDAPELSTDDLEEESSGPEPDGEDSDSIEKDSESQESGEEDPDVDEESAEGEALFSRGFSLETSATDSKMLRGRVSRFLNEGYEIQYSSQFQIPTGNLLYIATGGGSGSHVAEVVSSSPGNATIKVVDGQFVGRTSSIRIGVMR